MAKMCTYFNGYEWCRREQWDWTGKHFELLRKIIWRSDVLLGIHGQFRQQYEADQRSKTKC